MSEWHRIVKKYIRIKHDNLVKYFNPKFEEVLTTNKVLGVLARGTDYTHNKPPGHPIQPKLENMIQDVKRVMNEWKFDYVYLTTEDIDVQTCFCQEFESDKLLLSKQEKIRFNPKLTRLSQYKNVFGNVDMGHAYLKAIYDLSRCQGIIAGRTSGTSGAKILSSGYEYEYYYDIGKYPRKNKHNTKK